jgi:ribosomal protein L37AE/L43A
MNASKNTDRILTGDKKREAVCPTCKKAGTFRYLGEQVWPPHVAAALKLPTHINLWSCPHCSTTISEPDLLPLSAKKRR